MPTFWADRPCLVTGAGGFLGSRLCWLLNSLGARVTGVDLTASTPCWRAWHGQAPLMVAPRWTRGVVPEPHSAIFHLAGFSHIGEAQRRLRRAWATNVGLTWHMLDEWREDRDRGVPIQVIVVSSSNHVYGSLRARGRTVEQPWTESDALEPADTYGASKAAQDLCARSFARGYGLPIVALRHGNAYGPGDPHASHLVTSAVLSALRGEPPRLRGNGASPKPYLYLDDVCAAYLACAEHRAELPDAVNAAGPPSTTLMIARAVMRAAGLEGEPIVEHTDTSQDDYVEALDSTRLRAVGWAPVVDLEEGLRRTVAWYRTHRGMEWTS